VESKLSQAINNDTTFISGHMPTIQAGIKAIRHDQDRTQLDALKAWIWPTDFVAQHSDVLRRRYEGTGQWFLQTDEFVKWLDMSSVHETLLCTGMPGAGKTVLAAVVNDHLFTKVRNSTTAVVWLYCSYKSRTEQTVDVLLSAILQQLVRGGFPGAVKLMTQLQQRYDRDPETKLTRDEILHTLEAILAELKAVYIVVDALDECSVEDGTRHELLAHLDRLQSGANIRLMVTSRHLPDILERYRTALRIEVRAQNQDVKHFLAGQLHRLPRCMQRDADLQLMIQAKITEAIGGM
jgi:Cdc6-like AAA superfamily ATPase